MSSQEHRTPNTGTIKTITLTDASGVERNHQIDLAERPYKPSRHTRSAAIKTQCQECICDQSGFGSCAAQITLCTAFYCPLWDFRPVSSAPLSAEAMKGLPDHLIDKDWCSDPTNFRTRPYVGQERERINAIVLRRMDQEATATVDGAASLENKSLPPHKNTFGSSKPDQNLSNTPSPITFDSGVKHEKR